LAKARCRGLYWRTSRRANLSRYACATRPS